MKLNHDYQFQNSFSTLPKELFEQVRQTPITGAKLIHATNLRSTLGLDHFTDAELISWLNGEKRLEGDQRIATRYAGHQFGVWAGHESRRNPLAKS